MQGGCVDPSQHRLEMLKIVCIWVLTEYYPVWQYYPLAGEMNKMSIHYMSFDREKLERLKVAYRQAKAEGVEVLVFEGRELLVSYAKYVIEWLEGKLAKGEKGEGAAQ